MEIQIETLNQRISDIVAERERSLQRKFGAALSQLAKSIGAVENAAVSLEKATKQAWGSMTRPAMQHGVKLSEQVIATCRSMSAQKPSLTYEELEKYDERSDEALRSIVRTYNRYVPSIVRLVKSEAAAMEASIKDLNRSIVALSELLKESNLAELRLLLHEAAMVVGKATELRVITGQIQESREAIANLEEEQSRIETECASLNEDQGLRELGQVEESIARREQDMLVMLQPLSKAIRKLSKSENDVGVERAILLRMNDDPLASALELPVVQMRSLTASLEKLIEHDELLPDQRRKRKAREAIELLRKGGLERFREDHAILQANRQELLRQLKVSSTYERWLSLRRRSDQIRASIGQRQDQIAGLQLREGRLRESLLVEKSKMEARLRELLNEAVSIAITS